MREVNNYGLLIVTYQEQPQAVVLSLESYETLVRLAQHEQAHRAKQVTDLKQRFNQRLACLTTPNSRQALDDFMDEPLELNGQVRADANPC